MAKEEDRCIPCEEHARLHAGNWGFGPKNEPCQQCEEHVEMHKQERRFSWW